MADRARPVVAGIGLDADSTSLPRLPAALTSILLMLQPVTSVMLGAVLLDESPSAIQLSGVAIVLAAVAFATLGARSREPVPESA